MGLWVEWSGNPGADLVPPARTRHHHQVKRSIPRTHTPIPAGYPPKLPGEAPLQYRTPYIAPEPPAEAGCGALADVGVEHGIRARWAAAALGTAPYTRPRPEVITHLSDPSPLPYTGGET